MGAKDIKGHQFKPGQSGNPAGRPKGSRNRSTIAREMLDLVIKAKDPLKVLDSKDEEIAEALGLTQEEVDMIEENAETIITLSMIRRAKDGDVMAYRALLDSAYGTPKQTIEQKNTDIPPPKIEFTKTTTPSDEEK